MNFIARKLVGNIEPVRPEKPEPQSPSPKISHFTKPDKARARTFGKTVSPNIWQNSRPEPEDFRARPNTTQYLFDIV